MKITDIFNSGKITSTKKKGKAGDVGSADFGSLLDEPQEASSAEEAAPTSQVLGANILYSQALYSEVEVQRRHVHRGNRLLDNLDGIKRQMLDGELSYDSLVRVKEELKYAPQNTTDRNLQEIIKEIELRAEVEIAKLERINNLV